MASCASNTPKTRKSTASKASISSVSQAIGKLEEEERLAVIMIKVAVYHLNILHVSLLRGSVSSTVAMT